MSTAEIVSLVVYGIGFFGYLVDISTCPGTGLNVERRFLLALAVATFWPVTFIISVVTGE